MFGLICGVLIAFQPAGPDPARLAPELVAQALCVNGGSVVVLGTQGADGVPSWYWRDQDCRPSRPTNLRSDAERHWFDGRINGYRCRLWGWTDLSGAVRWRWDEQRSSCSPGRRALNGEPVPTGERPPEARIDPLQAGDLPEPSGVELPSGWRPKEDPKTGALLLGVDPEGLAKDPGQEILASDPATKKEAEDVKKFYEAKPDATAQAVARNLPPVVPPTFWAAVFGYNFPTFLVRAGGVVLLVAAGWLIHGHYGAAAR